MAITTNAPRGPAQTPQTDSSVQAQQQTERKKDNKVDAQNKGITEVAGKDGLAGAAQSQKWLEALLRSAAIQTSAPSDPVAARATMENALAEVRSLFGKAEPGAQMSELFESLELRAQGMPTVDAATAAARFADWQRFAAEIKGQQPNAQQAARLQQFEAFASLVASTFVQAAELPAELLPVPSFCLEALQSALPQLQEPVAELFAFWDKHDAKPAMLPVTIPSPILQRIEQAMTPAFAQIRSFGLQVAATDKNKLKEAFDKIRSGRSAEVPAATRMLVSGMMTAAQKEGLSSGQRQMSFTTTDGTTFSMPVGSLDFSDPEVDVMALVDWVMMQCAKFQNDLTRDVAKQMKERLDEKKAMRDAITAKKKSIADVNQEVRKVFEQMRDLGTLNVSVTLDQFKAWAPLTWDEKGHASLQSPFPEVPGYMRPPAPTEPATAAMAMPPGVEPLPQAFVQTMTEKYGLSPNDVQMLWSVYYRWCHDGQYQTTTGVEKWEGNLTPEAFETHMLSSSADAGGVKLKEANGDPKIEQENKQALEKWRTWFDERLPAQIKNEQDALANQTEPAEAPAPQAVTPEAPPADPTKAKQDQLTKLLDPNISDSELYDIVKEMAKDPAVIKDLRNAGVKDPINQGIVQNIVASIVAGIRGATDDYYNNQDVLTVPNIFHTIMQSATAPAELKFALRELGNRFIKKMDNVLATQMTKGKANERKMYEVTKQFDAQVLTSDDPFALFDQVVTHAAWPKDDSAEGDVHYHDLMNGQVRANLLWPTTSSDANKPPLAQQIQQKLDMLAQPVQSDSYNLNVVVNGQPKTFSRTPSAAELAGMSDDDMRALYDTILAEANKKAPGTAPTYDELAALFKDYIAGQCGIETDKATAALAAGINKLSGFPGSTLLKGIASEMRERLFTLFTKAVHAHDQATLRDRLGLFTSDEPVMGYRIGAWNVNGNDLSTFDADWASKILGIGTAASNSTTHNLGPTSGDAKGALDQEHEAAEQKKLAEKPAEPKPTQARRTHATGGGTIRERFLRRHAQEKDSTVAGPTGQLYLDIQTTWDANQGAITQFTQEWQSYQEADAAYGESLSSGMAVANELAQMGAERMEGNTQSGNAERLNVDVEAMEGQLDTLSEMTELDQMRLQKIMDARAKFFEMMSNMVKKQSDTASAITKNMA